MPTMTFLLGGKQVKVNYFIQETKTQNLIYAASYNDELVTGQLHYSSETFSEELLKSKVENDLKPFMRAVI